MEPRTCGVVLAAEGATDFRQRRLSVSSFFPARYLPQH